jgi:hypothetical protein
VESELALASLQQPSYKPWRGSVPPVPEELDETFKKINDQPYSFGLQSATQCRELVTSAACQQVLGNILRWQLGQPRALREIFQCFPRWTQSFHFQPMCVKKKEKRTENKRCAKTRALSGHLPQQKVE